MTSLYARIPSFKIKRTSYLKQKRSANTSHLRFITSSILLLFALSNRFFKGEEKQYARRDHGYRIRDGLCHVYAHRFVRAEYRGEDVY